MFSNLKRVMTLALLVSAAGPVLAVPSLVSNSDKASGNDVQQLQRLINNSNRLQARLQQQVDTQDAELSDLRGIVERNNYDMKQMVDRQRQLFIELDKLRTELNEIKSGSKLTTGSTVSTKVLQASGTEQEAYQSAVDLILKDRDYDGAITAFKAFQSKYPDSDYSSNTHYWLGQLYFAKKQDVDSAKSFAVVATDKNSSKRADALVKLGDIAKRNNNSKAANKYYQQVITEYPNSSAAKLAQSNM